MALKPYTKYPGQVLAPSVGYPYGEAKNETTPGAFDGTPFEKAMLNDIFGFQQALLSALGLVPSEVADFVGDSQYFRALVALASGAAAFYTDTGAANAYVFTPIAGREAPTAYFDGMIVKGRIANSCSGGSTLRVGALPIKTVKKRRRGSLATAEAVITGDINLGSITSFEYDATLDVFLLHEFAATDTLTGSLRTATAADQEAGTSTTGAVTPAMQQRHPSALKWWAQRNGGASPTIKSSYNITSFGDAGVGLTTVNFGTNFSGVDHGRTATIDIGGGGSTVVRFGGTASASSILVSTFTDDAVADVVLDVEWSAMGAGDQ